MKRLAIAMICAALAWAGWWFYASAQMRTATEAWFDARRTDGWGARYDEMQLLGFANRLDRTFVNVEISDPSGSIGWKAPFFQIFQLVYKPGHQILAWSDSQVLMINGAPVNITSSGLRASVIETEGGLIERANLESDTLTFTPPQGQPIALNGLKTALQRLDSSGHSYRLAVAANTPGANGTLQTEPTDAETLRSIRGDVTATFDQPWSPDVVSGLRPQLTQIELHMAEYRFGPLVLQISGEFDVDKSGLPSGEMTIRAENWQGLLDHARQDGQIPEQTADAVQTALELLTGITGTGGSLDTKLRLSAGKIWLGPVPIGTAPVLRIP